MTHSKNDKARAVFGFRTPWVVPVDQPCELGYHCPVCEYQQVTHGEYDERLQWSEYNSFLWCTVCDKDYPSALCLPIDEIDRAIGVFLSYVEDVLLRIGD